MLNRCWDYDQRNRPSVDVIVDILEQNPLLIVPCLDAPRPEVALDGKGSSELSVMPQFRNRTTQRSGSQSEHFPLRALSFSSNDFDIRMNDVELSPDLSSTNDPFPSLGKHPNSIELTSIDVDTKFTNSQPSDSNKKNKHRPSLRRSTSSEERTVICTELANGRCSIASHASLLGNNKLLLSGKLCENNLNHMNHLNSDVTNNLLPQRDVGYVAPKHSRNYSKNGCVPFV